MSDMIDDLLDGNTKFVTGEFRPNENYYQAIAAKQRPKVLWIGCSDSRVSEHQMTGSKPGTMFVHRNIANVVSHGDLNCLSVMQFAVDILKVKHVIVCGHYGCGGVHSALRNDRLGLIDNWLRHVQDVMKKHRTRLDALPDEASRLRRLCELNVMEQVLSVGETTVVQSAWDRGKALEIHGWIYDLHDGLLKDLSVCVKSPAEFAEVYRSVLDA